MLDRLYDKWKTPTVTVPKEFSYCRVTRVENASL